MRFTAPFFQTAILSFQSNQAHFRAFILTLTVSLFAAAPSFSFAQTPSLSLSSLIQRAVDRNSELAALNLEGDAAKATADQASRWEDPVLSIGSTTQVQRNGGTTFTTLQLAQSLPRPGFHKEREAAELAKADLKESERSFLEIGMRGKVLELIYLFKIAETKAAHAKERLQRFNTVQLYLKGRAFASPQRRAEAAIVRSKLLILEKELRGLESNELVAWNNANLYLGFQDRPTIRIPWYKTPESLKFDDVQKKFESANPEVKSQTSRVQTAAHELQVSKIERLPDISLALTYGNGKGANPEQDYALSLALPLPVFNGNRAEVRAQNSAHAAERARLDWLLTSRRSSLRSEFDRYNAAALTLKKLPTETIELQEHDMNEIDLNFKRGQVDLVTYLEADNQHSESLNVILDAQLDYLSTLRTLLLSAGEAPKALEI